MSDNYIIIPAILLVALLALLFEFSWKKGIIPQWLARKLLHITSVGACAIVPIYLNSLTLLFYLVAISEILLIYLVGSGRLFAENKSKKSWGIALFPVPYLALLYLFEDARQFIFLPMIILAIADAFACIAGTVFAKKFYTLTGDKKSIIGSIIFFLSCCCILFLFWNSPNSSNNFILSIIVIALILTSLEALGSTGSDNLLIPSGAAVLLFIDNNHLIQSSEYLLMLASIIIFVIVMLKLKWLEISGVLSAALLGFFVWRFAGWEYLIPLILFLASSAFIGKVLKVENIDGFEKKHGKARDWIQVLSNSWLYLILAIILGFYPENNDLIIPKLYAVMAIATADTWASEIGGKFSNNVIYLFDLKSHPKGISGGLSLIGTLSGFLGALCIACLGYFAGHLPSILSLCTVAFIGFAGMLLDSAIAAFFQKRYVSPSLGIYSDQQQVGFINTEKYRLLTNDQVNFITLCLALVI